jgi:ribonuclease P protein component
MTCSFTPFRLTRHADYQRVYKGSRKQHSRQMAYFVLPRPAEDASGNKPTPIAAPRIGLTVGKVMGKAVDRNRMKRRLREAIRTQISTLKLPVDVVLHPRRTVLALPMPELQQEIAYIFRAIHRTASSPAKRPAPSSRPV